MSAIMDVKETIKAAGGEEVIELRLRHFQEDIQYLHSLKQELLRKYLDQWVAVHDKSLVAHAKRFWDLRRQLSQKGIPQNETVIDFVSSKRRIMLL